MAATLFDYALREFPGRCVAPLGHGDTNLTLRANTLVVHVVDIAESKAVLAVATEHVGNERVGGVVVMRPHEPSLIPDRHEDTDGVVDLPRRRLVAAALLGAVLGAIIGFGVVSC